MKINQNRIKKGVENIEECKQALEYTYKHRKEIKKIQDEIDKLGL